MMIASVTVGTTAIPFPLNIAFVLHAAELFDGDPQIGVDGFGHSVRLWSESVPQTIWPTRPVGPDAPEARTAAPAAYRSARRSPSPRAVPRAGSPRRVMS
ncbi:hypothetical protein [Streptomyces minutiscleroticus]|uniref:hypothetical protein n=1 Tax=Streptomyces minutiscleroticus TaxID=68238 RepID=UPI003327FE6A